MTEAEQQAVMALAERTLTIARLVQVNWETGPRPGFVSLVTGPCPFLEGKSTCQVYAARPYACRRFACMRPDPKTEPLELAPHSPFLHYGNIGCTNLRERLMTSRVARRLYELIQRKAQKWAFKHGWSEKDA